MINFLKHKNISVSILNLVSLDNESLEDFFLKIKKYDNMAIHFDIADGKFANENRVNLDMIKISKKFGLFSDVHLMCSKPLDYIDKAIENGADNITVHYEVENIYSILKYLKLKKLELLKLNRRLAIGISIKPDTDIFKILNYLPLVDIILVMTVNPGFGGQKYINEINEKIASIMEFKKAIQIDGGVNNETILIPNKLGVTSFVVGSYITANEKDIISKIEKLKEIID